MQLLAKYATALTVPFELYALDGLSLMKTAAHAAGDTVIMKDEGAEANTTNGFVDRGSGYSIALTAAELTAARILLMVEDLSGPKVWLSRSFGIWTFGNASAHIPFDLSQAIPQVDVNKISGDTATVTALLRSLQGYVLGTAVTGTLSATEFTSSLTGYADETLFNKQGIWATGALVGQGFRVRQNKATNGRLIVTQMGGSPANTDVFVLY